MSPPPIPFLQMSGLGNAFITLDRRCGREAHGVRLDAATARAIAGTAGAPCDQIITLDPPAHGGDVRMGIHNADGSEAQACGNATRCVARLLMEETGRNEVLVETPAGALPCRRAGADMIAVDMSAPRWGWQEIPLARPVADTARLEEVCAGPLAAPCAVNVGNPHAVFFTDADPASVDLARWGPVLEHHEMFPERVNVSVARLEAGSDAADAPAALTLRVWERGAGLTRACGTAACAALAAAARRGRLPRPEGAGVRAWVHLPGGRLLVEWRADDHLLMTGPARMGPPGQVLITGTQASGTQASGTQASGTRASGTQAS